MFLAGGVAFNLLLAGVPFILLVASIIGFVLGESGPDATARVQSVLDRLLPPQFDVGGSILDPVLDDVVRTRTAVGVSGAVLFLWFSARLFAALRSVMRLVFEHGKDRSYVGGLLWDLHLSLMTVLMMGVWVFTSAWLTTGSGRIGAALLEFGLRDDALSQLEVVIGRSIAVGSVIAIFVSLYRWLPKQRTEWLAAFAGGVTAGALFEVARFVFGAVVRMFPPASIYTGTLGALVTVVFWTYYAALIFLVGAEVASATRSHFISPPPD
ncbi:MAG: YihY/virulence factor BrkB family protein [Gemmatimonadaceae bacterium]|nr:YihY/virulence factor BrkB family protein [Gemmatimonadaceae bacterium]